MVEQRPFAGYFNCSVVYEGRACSVLDRGRYLVIYKKDGSVMIHGADSLVARNYMGAKSRIIVHGNILTFIRKAEKIVVTVDEVVSLVYLEDWSEIKTKICKTEKELARKLFDNWCDYFDGDFETIELEFPTELGPIDLLGVTSTTLFVVEVKRKRASTKDVSQLRRYIEAVEGRKIVRGFLAAPDISNNALDYLHKHGLEFIRVTF
jgi:RecB family endonuclease NucS